MRRPQPIIRAEQHSQIPVHYASKTRFGIIVFAIVATAGLLAAFFFIHRANNTTESALSVATERASNQPVAVDAVRVTRSVPEKFITLPGDARSFYETTIFARTSGYLRKWLVDIGDRVDAGQVLATIETPELDDQLHEAPWHAWLSCRPIPTVAETSAAFAKISFDRWEPAAKGEREASAQERDVEEKVRVGSKHCQTRSGQVSGKSRGSRSATPSNARRVQKCRCALWWGHHAASH